MAAPYIEAPATIHPVAGRRIAPVWLSRRRAACAATMSSALSRTRLADAPVSSSVLRSQSTMVKPSTVLVASCQRVRAVESADRDAGARAAVAERLEGHARRASSSSQSKARWRGASNRVTDHLGGGAGHHELPLNPRTRRQRTAGIAQPELAQRAADSRRRRTPRRAGGGSASTHGRVRMVHAAHLITAASGGAVGANRLCWRAERPT